MPEERRYNDDIHAAAGPTFKQDLADAEITLSQLVAGIIEGSTSPRAMGEYFNPPPEARYISNRNICSRGEGSMESDAFGERGLLFDMDLDSTSEASNLSPPPFTFVSTYIGTYRLCV